MNPIVSAGWLADHLDSVVVCEVVSGRTDADSPAGHLPGARLVSVDDDLAGEPGAVVGRHPLPSPVAFARRMGALGVSRSAAVVAYDRHAGAYASRLVWMLRVLGQDAALLDGGFDAWTGPTDDRPARPAPVDRDPVPWPDGAVASADEVVEHLAQGGVVVDSRAAERYRGEVEPIDAVAGHVPGAINLPFAGNLVDGRFRAADELGRRFADVATDPEAIVYCGSGVTACHNAVAMEHAGLPRPRVYVGSWSGWSTDPERPIAGRSSRGPSGD